MPRIGRLKKGARFGARTGALLSFGITIFLGIVLFYAGIAGAVEVSLVWEANTEPDLAGYKIHYGMTPGYYDYTVDAGYKTTFTLVGLQQGRTYYISATAYDYFGNESGFSEELVLELPVGDDLLFSDDFSDGDAYGDPDWEVISGRWKVTAGGAYVSRPRRKNISIVGDPALDSFSSGRLESRFKMKVVRSVSNDASTSYDYLNGGVGTSTNTTSADSTIIFGYINEMHYRYVRITRRRIIIGQAGDYGEDLKGRKAVQRRRFRLKKWYQVRVDVNPDGLVEVYINNEDVPSLSYAFSGLQSGKVGYKAKKAKTYFDDLAVWNENVLL